VQHFHWFVARESAVPGRIENWQLGYFGEVVVAFESINPHNPSEVIGKFEGAGPYDVEIAVVHALSTAPKPPSPAIGKGSEATFLETEKESRHSRYWRKS